MCGIVGYVGARQAGPILLEGLRRLEYRGYDSAGIAVQNGHAFAVRKLAGRVNVLAEALARLPLAGTSGIGHTRRATHGAPTERGPARVADTARPDRKSTRLNSSHSQKSYAVFCLQNSDLPHPDVLDVAEGQAARVPGAQSVRQPVSHVRGAAHDGCAHRDQKHPTHLTHSGVFLAA